MPRIALLVLSIVLGFGLGPAQAQRVAPASEVFGNALSNEADAWLTDASDKYNEAQRRLHDEWLADAASYRTDLENAKIVFAAPKRKVMFDAKVIGSVRHGDKSWEWAWHNPNLPARARLPADKLKALGKRHDLRYLTHGMVPVPIESFPRILGGIALKLHGGAGVYRDPGDEGDVYLLLSNPRVLPAR